MSLQSALLAVGLCLLGAVYLLSRWSLRKPYPAILDDLDGGEIVGAPDGISMSGGIYADDDDGSAGPAAMPSRGRAGRLPETLHAVPGRVMGRLRGWFESPGRGNGHDKGNGKSNGDVLHEEWDDGSAEPVPRGFDPDVDEVAGAADYDADYDDIPVLDSPLELPQIRPHPRDTAREHEVEADAADEVTPQPDARLEVADVHAPAHAPDPAVSDTRDLWDDSTVWPGDGEDPVDEVVHAAREDDVDERMEPALPLAHELVDEDADAPQIRDGEFADDDDDAQAPDEDVETTVCDTRMPDDDGETIEPHEPVADEGGEKASFGEQAVARAAEKSAFKYPKIKGFSRVSQIDYWAKISGDRDVGREVVMAQSSDAIRIIGAALRIYGARVSDRQWCDVEQQPEDCRFLDLVVSIQLADHRGPVRREQLVQFVTLVEKLSRGTGRNCAFMADVDSALQQADAIADFIRCYDSLSTVNVKPSRDEPLNGADIGRAAAQLGLDKGGNNFFVRYMTVGEGKKVCLYSMVSMSETGEFDFENMKNLRTRGVTFFTRPATNRSPGAAFAEMVGTAEALASRVKAEVLAPNDDSLSQEAAEEVRRSIENMAREMEEWGLAPGSDEALRIFRG